MAEIVAGGRAITIKNLTLSTSDQQIGFSLPVNSLVVRCRTAIDLYIRTSNGSPDYFTVPAGQSLSLNLVGDVKDGANQPTNIWIRADSGTPVAEIIGIYGG